ncbi:MAG: nucleotidyltransferase family protein [Rhizomicrobium sp.]
MNAIGAVVLAAGSSSRMGADKLLLPLAGKPLVRHAVEAAAKSRATPVMVVIGHAGAQIAAALGGLDVCFVENKEFSEGLSTSLVCGLKTLPMECHGAAILLGDMPFVAPHLIDALIAAFDPAHGRSICIPTFQGRRGNPVVWARELFPEIMALQGDAGAKRLIGAHAKLVCEVEAADDGVLFDIDTREDLVALAARANKLP